MLLWLLARFGHWRFPRWVLRRFVCSEQFYVDLGESPVHGCLSTIQEAIDQCVPYRGDMIYVMPQHPVEIAGIALSVPLDPEDTKRRAELENGEWA